MRRTKHGGWPYSQPPNVPFEINRDSPQADGLVLWMPWGGGTPGAHRHVDRISGLVFTEGGTPVWVADGERGWSMLFDDAASEYLSYGSPVISNYPLTLSCRAYRDDVSDWKSTALVSICQDAGGGWRFWIMDLRRNNSLATQNARIVTRDVAGQTTASTTNSWTVNTWHHICAVLTNATDRAIFLDAGGKNTDVNDKTPPGLETTFIGCGSTGAARFLYHSGRIADVRIYNRALTDTQVYQLYAEPWELYKPLIRRWVGWRSPVPPPVGGHMTLWGRYWGP